MTYSKTYPTPYAYDAAVLFVEDLNAIGYTEEAAELEYYLDSFVYAPVPASDAAVLYAIGGRLSDRTYWKSEAYADHARVTLTSPH